MTYDTIIGLEVHVELSTKTKIFCGCSTEFGGEPNSHTCPVCLGLPGSLPLLNVDVPNKAIAAGLALNCEINRENIFDRKNYFYPDLPKDYQISQLYHPICQNGKVEIETAEGKKGIRIHEIHMEEDAGKLVHEAGASFVDYNRCGVPLIEIVSEPDMRNEDDVEAYIEALRETLVYLGVSDCKMQEGSMRVDVNLSIKEKDVEELGTRTETKNMNSIKAIKRAIAYERDRQIALIESGGSVTQETRRWDDNVGENYSMRSKENAQDYRYFPDPDLVPINIDEAWIEKIEKSLVELPKAKRSRYIDEYGISKKLAEVLTAEKDVADFFEAIYASLGSDPKFASEVANVVAGDVLRLIKENNDKMDISNVNPDKIALVIDMVLNNKINRNTGKEVIEAVCLLGIDPEKYVEERDLATISDEDIIRSTIEGILGDNQKSVADYKAGKDQAFGFLVGQTMRAFAGKADPAAVNRILKQCLVEAGIIEIVEESTDNKLDSDIAKTEKDEAKVGEKAELLPKTDLPAWKIADNKYSGVEKAQTLEIEKSGRYRDMYCDDLRPEHVGSTVKLAGWVNTIRNHGGIIFVDLRDQFGVTQVVVTDEQVARIGKEYSISVVGKVLKRDEDTINPNIATGEVELKAEELEILGPSRPTLPFEIEYSRDTREDLRLKYRFLDLRNPKQKDNLILRAEVIKHLRSEMESLGFMEVQTPILANSSPEGARDYLVPSRKHKGKFYALPQAPQQFKQLLMASGVDKYYQIAPCFRDEDARLDRSPGEFYQLDFEMAYATQEDVFAVAEKVLVSTFARFSDKKISKAPFVKIPYEESMLKYGSDKPDLRNPLVIIDLSKFFEGVDFAPFKGKPVRAIVVPDAIKQPRSFFSSMEKYALSIGMKGLGYISVQDDMTYKGPIDKFLSEDQKIEIAKLAELKSSDVLYFICDEPGSVAQFAGSIRSEIAERLDLVDKSRFDFCFITDYPMYEYNEEEAKIDFTHNPFSMPQGEMEALQNKDPLEVMAYQYDIVCNGVELSSGAVRNHRPDIMVKAFEIAGYTEKDVEQKFGALYNAFSYGAPPHAGMAPGVDRIVMLLAGEENIREIIAFPLNSNAQNLMLDSPSEVSEQQLRDVHIKIRS